MKKEQKNENNIVMDAFVLALGYIYIWGCLLERNINFEN